jgi:4,5-dihydroxyphthalate decarboxylase
MRALLADYPVTAALKKGAVRSPDVQLDFADVKTASTAFKRVVRDGEFDFAELAIVTYLIALAYGKPLVLLPTVIVSRFQHPYIVYSAERGALAPGDLAGRRVGIRSYSVTTVTWIRGILSDDYGVDLGSVKWVTFEEPHVAEFRDPPNLERAPAGKDLAAMLLAGEIDAAIVGDKVPDDPRIKTLIPDPKAAADAWYRKHGALQINHMTVVKRSLAQEHPEIVKQLYRLLCESKKAAGTPSGMDLNPFGFERNRKGLEIAIDQCYRQGLIPRRFAVDELFDGTTRNFN